MHALLYYSIYAKLSFLSSRIFFNRNLSLKSSQSFFSRLENDKIRKKIKAFLSSIFNSLQKPFFLFFGIHIVTFQNEN